MTLDEWSSALKLSTMYELSDIRDEVFEVLENVKLDGERRVILGREHKVAAWLMNGSKEVVEENVKSHTQLDKEAAKAVTKIRDKARELAPRCFCGTVMGKLGSSEYENIIYEELGWARNLLTLGLRRRWAVILLVYAQSLSVIIARSNACTSDLLCLLAVKLV